MSAVDFVPPGARLADLRSAAKGCQGCELYLRATQTVFGEGPDHGGMMLVGEQPGDREDRDGHPFVGPAGRLLDTCLDDAGIARADVYVTNAVKHFKWEERGKRRLHKKPSAREVAACKPWLEAEIDAVEPAVIVCLGSTAAAALLGAGFRVTRQRGQVFPGPHESRITATVHPSSLLRAPDEATRVEETQRFVSDLRAAAALLPHNAGTKRRINR